MARIILQNQPLRTLSESRQNSYSVISDRDILKKWSEDYLKLIKGIDAKMMDETKGKQALMEKIQEEFGTAELASLPLGIVSKCHLGHPYEVHTLDISSGQIIRHYKNRESLPDHFEKARTLAKHNAYAFVEVYKDKLILIREDGTAAKL
ncbi:hypothetical protein [Chryseobacterium sp. Leaf201]|uniref:hypothetical protein n=1 Tax=Chryseobacterium sp. Leaf201 TaxID=1735672 RepID=UPI0006F8EDCA|nr:hypothetical protein [Chryseobacterium sp. Leaf201]KQM41724.1 hypothetical protein ASE55_03685 [Chryseobacterium sp. Leaf201]